MAATIYEIDKYRMYHYNVDFISRNKIVCIIVCYKGNTMKGKLRFYEEGAVVPPSYKSDAGNLFLMFREKHLSDMLETLRQEKPLYIWYSDQYNLGRLQTFMEPVGEEES